MDLNTAKDAWLQANEVAVDEAQKCMTKKGDFNPSLGKPWPKYEEARKAADEKWYVYYNLVKVNK